MSATPIRLGTTEDGRPLFHYAADHAVITGPITGTVTTDDGTTYDVNGPVVVVDSADHALEVAHLVSTRYALEGHPNVPDGFIYIPSTASLPDDAITMALASTAAEAAALNGLDGTGATNVIGFVSVHTASPGTTGANEYAGVTRQSCAWNAANTGAGTKTNSSALTFTTSGVSAVTHAGTWTLVSAGAFSIGLALGASVTAATITVAAGALTLSAS